jgi:lincosamide and streptogramin A transport system ATP-binding/permease protein
MSLINVTNLTFAYDGSYDNIFENVCFQIDTDWKLGFCGRNGRGKTTFLNLLLGRYAYSGSITANTAFEYFPFDIENKDLETMDAVGAIVPDYQEWELIRELNLLQVGEGVLHRPFNTLSNGEQTKVLLAALFLKENSFLLIDEPTNHLDLDARKAVGDYLNTKKGFILVSHDRALLDSCADHILSINKTDIEIQKGNFSSWWYNKNLKDGFEAAENERLLKDVRRLEDASRRTSQWSDAVEKTKKGTLNSGLKPDKGYIGHKAAKMMKRSKAIENRRQSAIEEKSQLLRNVETSEKLKIAPLRYHSDQIAEFEKVGIFYGKNKVCENVSFAVSRGDRIALRGKNGSGKSSIIKLLCGEPIPYEGTIRIGSGLKISYISQDAGFLKGGLAEYAKMSGVDESLFKAILRKLDFSRAQFEKDMSDYSAGQKKKVLIAKSLCEQAHIYVWDEPLNYIDVISRIQIEELIKEYKPTILFVEHDAAFCDCIATKTVNM